MSKDRDPKKLKERFSILERKIEELKRGMPAHSRSVEMMCELEDLEEELAGIKSGEFGENGK